MGYAWGRPTKEMIEMSPFQDEVDHVYLPSILNRFTARSLSQSVYEGTTLVILDFHRNVLIMPAGADVVVEELLVNRWLTMTVEGLPHPKDLQPLLRSVKKFNVEHLFTPKL
jgi:hypothetical protein